MHTGGRWPTRNGGTTNRTAKRGHAKSSGCGRRTGGWRQTPRDDDEPRTNNAASTPNAHRQTGAGLILASAHAVHHHGTQRSSAARCPKGPIMTTVLTRHAVIARVAEARHRRRSPQLGGANLTQAGLASLNLEQAFLQGANLAGANLAGTNLAGAYLQHANLAGANLHGANLVGANFSQANLDGTIMNGTQLGRTYLGIRDIDRATTGQGPFIPPWHYGTHTREPVQPAPRSWRARLRKLVGA